MEDIQDTVLSFSDLNVSQESKSISSNGSDKAGSETKKTQKRVLYAGSKRIITFGPNAIGDRKHEQASLSFGGSESASEFQFN